MGLREPPPWVGEDTPGVAPGAGAGTPPPELILTRLETDRRCSKVVEDCRWGPRPAWDRSGLPDPGVDEEAGLAGAGKVMSRRAEGSKGSRMGRNT